MNAILNAYPRPILEGFRDISVGEPVYEQIPIPTHLPLFLLYAEKGPTEPQLVEGDAIVSTYGAETFNPFGPYYTHQTVFADLVKANQTIMIQRILPEDVGPESRLLLSLDIVAENIPQYERNPDGSFRLDNAGAKIPTGDSEPGFKAKWVLNDWKVGPTEEKPFGEMTQKAGSLTNQASAQSTLYPVLEFKVSSKGKHGNDLGLRFSAPNTASGEPINESLYEAIKSYLYRFQFVRRSKITATGQVVPTLIGAQYVDATLKADQIDFTSTTQVSAQDILIDEYEQLDEPGLTPQWGPFSALKVYDTNLKALLAQVGGAEAPLGLLPVAEIDADSEWLHAVNIFTGANVDGVPYNAYQLLGPTDGGVLLSENTTLYATGGSDGTLSASAFDLRVRAALNEWLTPATPLMDWARYPLSAMYDSGFSLETKKAFFIPMSRRRDMWVQISTQDVSQPQNTPTEDTSIAIALANAAAAYPESVIHGTPVARALIVGQSGRLLNHTYRNILPLGAQLAESWAKYMGAGTGVWNEAFAPDIEPNNHITRFRDVNNTFKPADAYQRDWDTGLIWAQHYDHRSLFFPALQTAYREDSSVLNAAITMMVAVEATKAALRSWRGITGRQDLTEDQVVAKINADILADMEESRFGGRFIITPRAYYTKLDQQRGYSYHCAITIGAPGMVTVGTYTIELDRRPSSQAGA